MAVRLPKKTVDFLGLKENFLIMFNYDKEQIVIKPKKEKEYTLDELLDKVTPENIHEEVDWGETCWKRSMVKNKYIREQGDIVWLDFDPAKGHEQKGRRPAFVLSFIKYNKKIGLALFCPITSVVKRYPFETFLISDKINGVILVDQIKSYDWRKKI